MFSTLLLCYPTPSTPYLGLISLYVRGRMKLAELLQVFYAVLVYMRSTYSLQYCHQRDHQRYSHE